MEDLAFSKLKTDFKAASTDKKIEIYTTVEGLTQTQYKELLRDFPYGEISKLERALS